MQWVSFRSGLPFPARLDRRVTTKLFMAMNGGVLGVLGLALLPAVGNFAGGLVQRHRRRRQPICGSADSSEGSGERGIVLSSFRDVDRFLGGKSDGACC